MLVVLMRQIAVWITAVPEGLGTATHDNLG